MRSKPAAVLIMGLSCCLLTLSACFFPVKDSGIKLSSSRSPVHFDVNNSHGNHPAALTEWWYFNGHLETSEKNTYSYGFCLFRASSLLYFAHVSFTDDEGNDFVFDRIFYPVNKVKFQKEDQLVSYGEEQVIEQLGEGSFKIKGKVKGVVIELQLDLVKEPMTVNGNGVIDMPEGGNSFYYSLTRLKTSGKICIKGQEQSVEGLSWMDHQWGQYFIKNKGWDWFSLQMDDSTDYNIYSFRSDGGRILKQYVNILDANNHLSTFHEVKFNRARWWKNPLTTRNYVTAWELVIPGNSDTIAVVAKKDDQEIYQRKGRDFCPSYWEGACIVLKKTQDGKIIPGRGFAEHFPYPNPKQ